MVLHGKCIPRVLLEARMENLAAIKLRITKCEERNLCTLEGSLSNSTIKKGLNTWVFV